MQNHSNCANNVAQHNKYQWLFFVVPEFSSQKGKSKRSSVGKSSGKSSGYVQINFSIQNKT